MAKKKYALLDTDFISKMHLIRKDDENKLIDKIMAMPNYTFYCHKQISIELLRHNIAGAPAWFKDKVENQYINLYDDKMILDDLTFIYGELAIAMYIEMLKNACDAYKDGYFIRQKKRECVKYHVNKYLMKCLLEKLKGPNI